MLMMMEINCFFELLKIDNSLCIICNNHYNNDNNNRNGHEVKLHAANKLLTMQLKCVNNEFHNVFV